jgi:ABC-type dipeptide/oligopeptide/nickel transport system permease subunit
VLSIKEKEFIEAAHAAGSAPTKIILKHLLPNSLGPVIVVLTFGIPAAIFTEAILDFIGVGIRHPQQLGVRWSSKAMLPRMHIRAWS